MNKDQFQKAGSAAVARVNSFRKQHTKAFYAIVIALVLLLMGGCSSATTPKKVDQSTPQQQISASAGELSFMLEADEWDTSADGDIAVLIKGTADDGSSVSQRCTAIPGERCRVDIQPGDYEISLADGKASKGNNLFVAAPVPVRFDGSKNCDATLRMKLDSEKMKQLEKEAAAKKAEEEKAAKQKAEAEKQAKAKQEAAAKKQATQKATTQKAPAQTGQTVYIASSGKGKKYHSKSTCSGMKGATSLSKSAAESQGYTPCKKCY